MILLICCHFGFSKTSHDNISSISNKNLSIDLSSHFDNAPPACPQADITVSVNTDWNNQTVNMCPNQRIIVNNGATLSISNTTIQLDPSMTGKWGGIIVNGATSKLDISNNSTIKQVPTAITTTNSNFIRIVGSTIMDCERALSATRSSNPGGPPHIYITQSNISNSSDAQLNLINLKGYYTVITRSILSNNSTSCYNGIVANYCKLFIRSTKIASFYTGIQIPFSGSAGNTSLQLYYSDILRANRCIHSRAMNLDIFKNILSGQVYHRNSAMGNWNLNNFLGGPIKIENVNISHVFTGNKFTTGTLLFAGDQSLTDATCNEWTHCNPSVDGTATNFKHHWGYYGIKSNNRHVSGCTPIMRVYALNDVIDHNYAGPIFTFDYRESFMPLFDDIADTQCYDSPRRYDESQNDTMINPITEYFSPPIYNDSENNSDWENYNESYLQALDELNGADPSTNPVLLNQIENSKVGMGQCVSKAFIAGDENLTQSQLNVWLARSAPVIEHRRIIYEALEAQDFSNLINYLSSLNLAGLESADRNNMIHVIEWLQEAVNNQLDIYNLNSQNLEELIDLVTQSFDDYSEAIRGWLNFYYQLDLDPPSNYYLKQSKSELINSHSLVDTDIKLISLEPECLLIYSSILNSCNVEIFDLVGSLKYQNNIDLTNSDCIKVKLTSGLYKIRISGSEFSNPIVLSYFLK